MGNATPTPEWRSPVTDLIWIGNTLYPRWIVFAALGLIIVALAGLSVAMTPKDGEQS